MLLLSTAWLFGLGAKSADKATQAGSIAESRERVGGNSAPDGQDRLETESRASREYFPIETVFTPQRGVDSKVEFPAFVRHARSSWSG